MISVNRHFIFKMVLTLISFSCHIEFILSVKTMAMFISLRYFFLVYIPDCFGNLTQVAGLAVNSVELLLKGPFFITRGGYYKQSPPPKES